MASVGIAPARMSRTAPCTATAVRNPYCRIRRLLDAPQLSWGVAFLAERSFSSSTTYAVSEPITGTPEEAGWAWDVRLDFLYDLKLLKASRTFLFAGVRGSFFTDNFNFVGGNEDFDVTTEQIGLGAGLKGVFAMGRQMDLILSVGGDYFVPASISGHDTSYGPDGEDVKPREGYDYQDADAAVNQPKFQPSILVGVGYRF